jgi:hypothetical protein
MNNRFAFLPMVEANDLLDDPEALRAQLDRDGYLFFRQILDRETVNATRRGILKVLGDLGWTESDTFPLTERCIIPPFRETDEEFLAGYQGIQKLEEFHSLAHDPTLTSMMQKVLGETAFPHPLKIARVNFPDSYETSTPPHQDFPNNQGTPSLTATWIPVCDMTEDMGGLAIMRGSHKWGQQPVAGHMGAGNRCAVISPEMNEACRWVTTDFLMGDVLVFPSLTVHAALHNASEFLMRLSVDFRYQLEGEPLTAGCLEPHFQRLSWEEIYAGWKSKDLQYYWKDLDYEVVPFEEIPIVDAPDTADMGKRDFADIFRYLIRRDARVARRFKKLGISGFEPMSEKQGLLTPAPDQPASNGKS